MRNSLYVLIFLMLAAIFSYSVSASVFNIPDMDRIPSILSVQDGNYKISVPETSYSANSSEQNPEQCISDSLHSFKYNKDTGIWGAYNPGQDISVSTDGSGSFCLDTEKGSFSMSLSGIGRPDLLTSPGVGDIRFDGRFLDSVHEGFTEWYVNGDAGIEHGMTIMYSPPGKGKLVAGFDVTGELTPSSDGQNIYFSGEKGRVLKYTGLRAWDSAGRALETSLNLSGNTICWDIDDEDAVYPVTVDPVFTLAETLYGRAVSDCFGYSVSVSGDYAISGAPYNDTAGVDAGVAYIYKNDGSDNWGLVKTLYGVAANDWFGRSVSISGDYAIAGAPMNDTADVSAGVAYIYKKDLGGSDNWGLVKTLYGVAGDDWFGRSVSISGDYAIAGAPRNDTAGDFAGAAYIYKKDLGGSDNWGLVKTLSGVAANDWFGNSVSLSDDYGISGALYNDVAAGNAGAAYLYKKDLGGLGNWGLVKTLYGVAKDDYFGNSVSVFGDYAISGAYGNDTSANSAGVAYIFKNDGSDNWNLVKTLYGVAEFDMFGNSVSISGDYAISGAFDNDTAFSNAGAAYIYKNDGLDNWGLVKTLYGVAKDDYFGYSVSISGDYAIAGAYGNDTSGSSAGAVYLYTLYPIFNSFSPATGINNNNALAVSVIGSNYHGTPVVKLKKTGETDITATGVILAGDTEIDCIFDINGASAGVWNVEITNPNSRSVTGAGVFTVIASPAPVSVSATTGSASSDTGSNTDTGLGKAENLGQGDSASFKIDKGAVYEVTIIAGEDIPEVMVTVCCKHSFPWTGPVVTGIYEYEDVKVYKTDESSLSGGSFKFMVSKYRLSSKGYTKGDIVMMHYNGESWDELVTTLIDEDSEYYFYEAETPGFSWFAIAIAEGSTIVPEKTLEVTETETEIETAVPVATETITPAATASHVPTAADAGQSESTSVLLPAGLAGILIVGLIGAGIRNKRRNEEYPDWWYEKRK